MPCRKFLEKVFQQNLRAQIKKVSGFVKQQQVGRMQQAAPRALLSSASLQKAQLIGPSRYGSFDFKLRGDFAAFPVGLPAVSHQKIKDRFAWQKRSCCASSPAGASDAGSPRLDPILPHRLRS